MDRGRQASQLEVRELLILRILLIALMLVASAPALADDGETFEFSTRTRTDVWYVHHATRVAAGVCFGPATVASRNYDVIEDGDTHVLFFTNDFSADAACKLKVDRGAPFFEFNLPPAQWANVQAHVREMAVCLSGRSCAWCDATCAKFALPSRLIGAIDAREQGGFEVALWNATFNKRMVIAFDAASNAPSSVRYVTR